MLKRVTDGSRLFVCLGIFAMTGLASAQERGAVKEYYHDFKGQPLSSDLARFQITDEVVLKPEAAGLRITIPRNWIHPFGGVGVNTVRGIKGDFQVTASYEILQADTPARGYGVGVGIRVYKAAPSQEVACVARVIRADGKPILLWSRTVEAPGEKVRYPEGKMPWPSKTGRLRLMRTQSMLLFQAAPGLTKEEFQTINIDAFGEDDIRTVAMIGFTGRFKANLDARFLDLHIKSGASLPVMDTTVQEIVPDEEQRAGGLLVVVLALGLISSLLLALGVGIWVTIRQRRSQRDGKADSALIVENDQ